MDYNKILIGVLYGFVGQIGSFLQLQGAIKFGWYEKYLWLILIASVPICWLYIKSVEYLIQGSGGEIWPSRIMGFAVGIIVFSILSIYLFDESITTKTFISLILAFCILAIQLFMK